jgi:hypothetical protein
VLTAAQVSNPSSLSALCGSQSLYGMVLNVAGVQGLLCGQCQQFSCATCALSDPTDYTALPACLSCAAGFFLDGEQCLPLCGAQQYLVVSSNATGNATCASCYFTCRTCGGPNAGDCITCRRGYAYNSVNGTCDVFNAQQQRLTEALQCGNDPSVFYSDVTQACECLDAQAQFWNGSACLYVSDWLANALTPYGCALSEYFNATRQSCASCSRSFCSVCTDTTQCFKCIDGYFLDRTTGACTPCAANCQVCRSTATCELCSAGTVAQYLFNFVGTSNSGASSSSTAGQQQSWSVQCLSSAQCLAGSLPLLPSVYTLNRALWTDAEISLATDMTTTPPSTTTAGAGATVYAID